MSWTSISWVIPKKIRELGIERLFQVAELKNEWDEILAKILGDKFTKKSKLINLKNEVLVVDCLNSVWANELRLRETRILEEIKNKNSQLKINKISFIC